VYILDTNVLSELRPGKAHASAQVRAWAETVPQSQFFLSSITVLEHEIGIGLLERRVPAQGSAMRAWWDATRTAFERRILAFAMKEALLCAPLHVPDRRAFRDSMIAATALSHGFTVVTRNVADFTGLGVRLLDPWNL
jgi:predicted nucleic acid-binding protein